MEEGTITQFQFLIRHAIFKFLAISNQFQLKSYIRKKLKTSSEKSFSIKFNRLPFFPFQKSHKGIFVQKNFNYKTFDFSFVGEKKRVI